VPRSLTCWTRCLSVEEVGIYKPHPRVYQLAGRAAWGSRRARSRSSPPTPGTPGRHPPSACGWCGATAMISVPEKLPGRPDREIRSLAELPALLGLELIRERPDDPGGKSQPVRRWRESPPRIRCCGSTSKDERAVFHHVRSGLPIERSPLEEDPVLLRDAFPPPAANRSGQRCGRRKRFT